MNRLRLGRLSLYVEPRDVWIGAYIAPTAIYLCPLPLIVFKWDRGAARAPESGSPDVQASGQPDHPQTRSDARTAPRTHHQTRTPHHRNEDTP